MTTITARQSKLGSFTVGQRGLVVGDGVQGKPLRIAKAAAGRWTAYALQYGSDDTYWQPLDLWVRRDDVDVAALKPDGGEVHPADESSWVAIWSAVGSRPNPSANSIMDALGRGASLLRHGRTPCGALSITGEDSCYSVATYGRTGDAGIVEVRIRFQSIARAEQEREALRRQTLDARRRLRRLLEGHEPEALAKGVSIRWDDGVVRLTYRRGELTVAFRPAGRRAFRRLGSPSDALDLSPVRTRTVDLLRLLNEVSALAEAALFPG